MFLSIYFLFSFSFVSAICKLTNTLFLLPIFFEFIVKSIIYIFNRLPYSKSKLLMEVMEEEDLSSDLKEFVFNYIRDEPEFSGFDDFCNQLDLEEKKFLKS